MSRIAIIAALPREIELITRGWSRRPVQFGSRKLLVAWSDQAIAVAAGMGAANAVRALDLLQTSDELRDLGPISAVASVGFAGALTSEAYVGKVLRPSTVLDVRTGERYAAAEGDGSLCVTLPVVAEQPEKARLTDTYNAQLVDMEAAALARICSSQVTPFYAFKAISDGSGFSLPALNNFASPEGEFRTAAFALHVAMRPWLWRSAVELGRGAGVAKLTLAAEIRAWLASQSGEHLSL